jgi:glycosyltransferase involved in cell wall biosynthesis
VHYLGWQLTGELRRFESTAGRLSEEFRRLYPAREDQMSAQELQDYRSVVPLWRELFACYDLIQAYATSPIIPMLAGARPYVGFEHGTLRDFTLKQNAVSRATTLAYRLADHVFITNGDCLEYARAIGLKDYSPMLHPVDEERIRSVSGDYEGLHRELGRKWIFLCPLRHDWEAKGTDRYVRALPALVEAVGDDFSVLMMKWGKELEASRRLSDALGVSHLIRWIEPLGRRRLIEMQKSVDAVFDQLVLPHFGGTAPEALAAGVPVVMSYDPRSTEWLVERPAPILSARTTEDIVEAVKRALDPEWLTPFRSAAREWIDGCHNGSVLIERHLVAYRRVLERYGTLVERPA